MPVADQIRKLLPKDYAHSQAALWVVAFVCVTVLVGLGKLKPETIEYLLFALLGLGVSRRTPKVQDNDSTSD